MFDPKLDIVLGGSFVVGLAFSIKCYYIQTGVEAEFGTLKVS